MRNWKELAIVLLLAGLCVVLAGGGMRRWTAQEAQTICASHLRELHGAMQLYLADNGDWYPPSIIRRNRWGFWTELVNRYVADQLSFSCPVGVRGPAAFIEDDLLPHAYSGHYVSYGMNYYLSSSGERGHEKWPARAGNVARPSYVITLGDTKGPNHQIRPTSCWGQDYSPVHEGSANFLLADGHTESHNQDTLGLVSPIKGWKRDPKRWQDWITPSFTPTTQKPE
ncbi:MAG: hypothetical protein IJJ33_03950 [Victivallales bacterium]|nr:hypothetical protein [Victivallales bacterium]